MHRIGIHPLTRAIFPAMASLMRSVIARRYATAAASSPKVGPLD